MVQTRGQKRAAPEVDVPESSSALQKRATQEGDVGVLDDDDDDIQYQPGSFKPSHKSKGKGKQTSSGASKRKSKAPTLGIIGSTKPFEALDTALNDEVALLLQRNDPGLVNTLRIAKILRDSSLRRQVQPTLPSGEREQSLRDVLVPTPGRDVRVLSIKKNPEKGTWILSLGDATSATQRLFPNGQLVASISYDDVSADDDDTIAQVVSNVPPFLNAWPWPVVSSTSASKHGLVSVMLEKVLPRDLPTIPHVSNDGNAYKTAIPFFDPHSGELLQHVTRIMPTTSSVRSITLPTLPTLRIFNGQGGIEVFTQDTLKYLPKPSVVKEDKTSLQAQKQTHHALHFIALKCSFVVATRTRMEEMVSFWRRKIGIDTVGKSGTHQDGIYGGQGLFVIWQYTSHRQLAIRFTKAVYGDLGVDPFQITINSLNANRTTPVLDTLVQVYTSGQDIRVAILEAAEVADQVNRDIEDGAAPSSRCDCDNDLATTELHCCECCTAPVICMSRTFDNVGRLVCLSCVERQKLAGVQGSTKNETLVQTVVRRSFEQSFIKECRLAGRDPYVGPQDRLGHAALNKLMSKLSDDTPLLYTDEYTSRDQQIAFEVALPSKNPSRRRLVPEHPSVDAIFPFQVSQVAEGLSFVHAENNVAITSTVLQYAKYTFLPGVLAVIGNYLRLDSPSEHDQRDLFEVLRPLQVLRCKAAHYTAVRSRNISRAQFDRLMTEWVSGHPVPGEHGEWDTLAQIWTRSKMPPHGSIWSDDICKRLNQVVVEIELAFNKRLIRAPDGAPWIGIYYTMPLDWSWNAWALFCEERCVRMRTRCNKKWQQKDTPESLFCEIIYQTCTDDKRYGDGLNLPLVVYLHHPLRLSIGHRHHGFAMYSGWSPNPSSLSERVDEDNNLLIESWYWNSGKKDMDESFYQKAKEILKSIKMPTHLYDPSQKPPQDADPELAHLYQIAEIEDVGGESFGDDAVSKVEDELTAVGKQEEEEGNEEETGAEMED